MVTTTPLTSLLMVVVVGCCWLLLVVYHVKVEPVLPVWGVRALVGRDVSFTPGHGLMHVGQPTIIDTQIRDSLTGTYTICQVSSVNSLIENAYFRK